MRKSSLPVSLKTLIKYNENQQLDLYNPVQRSSNQWNLLQQSLLIHSILADYIVPGIYLVKDDDRRLSVLDGKQRLTTMFDFVNNKFGLHPKTPSVVIDGVSYEISGKTFDELEQDVRSEILQYRFQTYQL